MTHPTILICDKIADEAHGSIGQQRKWSGDPYVVHVRRVAAAAAALDGFSVEDVAAALLHDVLEDVPAFTTAVLYRRLLNEGIPLESAAAILGMVLELTDPYDHGSGLSRLEKRTLDWVRFPHKSRNAKRLKMLDRLDNLSGFIPKKMAYKYIPETTKMIELIGDADPVIAGRLAALVGKIRENIV